MILITHVAQATRRAGPHTAALAARSVWPQTPCCQRQHSSVGAGGAHVVTVVIAMSPQPQGTRDKLEPTDRLWVQGAAGVRLTDRPLP